MITPKPAWASEYGATYEDIVRSWDFDDIEALEEFGSYQGDYLVMVRDEGRMGLVVFGYGSCSGCDELQAANPWDDDGDWTEVVVLANELADRIHWESTRDHLRDWIDANPQNHWWCYDDDIARWLNANLGTHLREDA